MKNQRLGCLSPIAIAAALITLLTIASVGMVQGGSMFSPGKLNDRKGSPLGMIQSHAELGGDCQACHTAPWETASMADRCSDCHLNIQVEMKDATTLHGALTNGTADSNCLKCHTEHHGADALITNIAELVNFPHQVTGFSLTAHKKETNTSIINGKPFDCENCHNESFARFDQATCFDCHAEIDRPGMQEHVKAFGAVCLNCHDGVDSHGKGFDHSSTGFALQGKHNEVKCSGCHQKQETIAAIQSTATDCISCHQADDKHNGVFGTDCSKCHTASGWDLPTFNHNSDTGFQLTGKHQNTACEDCHTTPDLASTPTDCAGCHKNDDPHQTRLGSDCAACHKTEAWTPSTYNHSQSTFQLIGKHQNVECGACHTDRLFIGTPTTCAACHTKDDAHKGSFGTECSLCHTPAAWKPSTFNHAHTSFPLAGAHQIVTCQNCHSQGFRGTATACAACHTKDDAHRGSLGSECSLCHTTAAWKPSTFNHAHTSFPLTGAHQGVSCQSCHSQGFRGTSTACAACHSKDDTHRGSFGSECSICHNTAAWKPSTFDHARSNFPLTGAHQRASCQNCHSQGYRGTSTACAACHSKNDPHQGSFGSECSLCHTTSAWKPSTFDHSRSRFPLTGAHQRVSCQNCHSQGYRGTPLECIACHGQPSYHAGMFSNSCNSCHNTSAWRPAPYNGPHEFNMNHEGAGATCRDCHPTTLSTYSCVKCHPNGIEDD